MTSEEIILKVLRLRKLKQELSTDKLKHENLEKLIKAGQSEIQQIENQLYYQDWELEFENEN